MKKTAYRKRIYLKLMRNDNTTRPDKYRWVFAKLKDNIRANAEYFQKNISDDKSKNNLGTAGAAA